MNILIANENSLVAEGIGMIVKSSYRQANITITDNANNLEQMLNRHATHHWNVILIDEKLSNQFSADQLHKLSPKTAACLFYSKINSQQDTERFKEGLNERLSASATPAEVGRAINLLLSGQNFLFNGIDLHAQKPGGDTQKGHDKNAITYRQQEILSLMALGLSNKEIANRLHVAESTTKRHLSNIFRRLEVNNRVEAARRASELGLLLN